MSWYRISQKGVCLQVKVHPRASKTGVSEVTEAYVKISLTSPPVEGEANKELVIFLSKYFAVPRQAIEIKSGQTGRLKLVEIGGLTEQALLSRLNK